jgi:hypothetical protein
MNESELWEYRVESMGSAFKGLKDEEIQDMLDEWGEQGWEVINLIQTSGCNKVRIVAKRKLGDRARRQRSMPGN